MMEINNVKDLKEFLKSKDFSADDLVSVENGNIKIIKRKTVISVLSLLQFVNDIDDENYKVLYPPVDGVLIIEDNNANQYPICIDNNIEGIKDINSNTYVAYDYVEKDNSGNEITRIRLWSENKND